MKIRNLILSGVMLGAMPAAAQSTQSFQEFRQGILNDFQDFRKTVLDHYADFLNGTWHEYEPLEPLKRNDTPKPMDVPDVRVSKPGTVPADLPTPSLADLPPVKKPDKEVPDEKPASPFDLPKPIVPPEAKDAVPPTIKVKPDLGGSPLIAALPVIPGKELPEEEPVETPETPAESREGKDPVSFYGMEILVPQVDFNIMQSIGSAADFARNWKLMEEQDMARNVMPLFKQQFEKMGLNDYLAYEFLCAYMDSKFPAYSLASKFSAVHYILSNLGYDVRIALSTKTGDPVLLMPSQQKLYGKVYMTLGGERYYVLTAPGVNIMGSPIATCDLPKVASSGKRFDLRIKGLNLPVKERPFNIEYGKIKLSGVLNENLMPLVYRYPQMDTADFAESVLDNNLRRNLVAQLKEQLNGVDKNVATDQLLEFVQFGFSYATDDSFHGFEKPYFLEENLYYPKNDCEDRAIFYTYMLWNVLGVENHLLFYPGHESAAVALSGGVSGTGYDYNGKRFYISDPTYVGSRTGQCMPQFVTVEPKIDLTLPREQR